MTAVRTGMILAAGFGTRMRPITDVIPKAMVEVAGKPLIGHALDYMVSGGITRIVVNTHYLPELLESYLLNWQGPAIVMVSREAEILETGGGVVNALPLLGDEVFAVMNSDAIVKDEGAAAIPQLAALRAKRDADTALLIIPTAEAHGYDGDGDFHLSDTGQLIRASEGEAAPYMYSGVQVMHRKLLEGRRAEKFSLSVFFRNEENPLAPLPGIVGMVHDGLWLHVGEPGAIEMAESKLINWKRAA